MQVHPNHHADDIGAMFADPSGFKVLIKATGVPKYKIEGSIVLCMSREYGPANKHTLRFLRRR